MTRVVIRSEAEADLLAITAVIAEHTPRRAKSFAKRLRARFGILESHPFAGRPRPELGEGLRSLFERPYVLIYRVQDDTAEVIAVLHGARDLPQAIASRIAKET